MGSRFAVTLQLHVTGGPNRAANFERLTDCYAELEASDGRLLDCAWSFSDHERHSHVTAEITVGSDDLAVAYDIARGSVRAAIQAAGGWSSGRLAGHGGVGGNGQPAAAAEMGGP